LARRLRDHWEYHNCDIYELLDFADVDSLEMICHHYKLDATFKEKDALKGKIEKANLLLLDKKLDVAIDRNHDPLVLKTKASLKVDDSKSHSKKTNTQSNVHDRKSNSKKTNTRSKVNNNKSNHKKPKTTKRRVFSLKKLFSKLTE